MWGITVFYWNGGVGLNGKVPAYAMTSIAGFPNQRFADEAGRLHVMKFPGCSYCVYQIEE